MPSCPKGVKTFAPSCILDILYVYSVPYSLLVHAPHLYAALDKGFQRNK